MRTLLLSPEAWCTRFSSRVYFPVLCNFWQHCGGVNGDLLQEGLCHTQVCCTQSPGPCGSPLLTCTSTGHAQTPFCLSLCGILGAWCTQGLLEPSECLWREWGLILNSENSGWLYFGGSKITEDGDCSHEIKRHLLLGRKVMTNLDSIIKSRDITLPTRVRLVKAMVFPVVMCGCETWTIKKAESRRIDAFELWC